MHMAFTNGSIGIWAYNIETVLAEKVETILQRGELNTRPRDFYDVYILTKTQVYDQAVFLSALTTTAEHRKTSHIFNETTKRLGKLPKVEHCLLDGVNTPLIISMLMESRMKMLSKL